MEGAAQRAAIVSFHSDRSFLYFCCFLLLSALLFVVVCFVLPNGGTAAVVTIKKVGVGGARYLVVLA